MAIAFRIIVALSLGLAVPALAEEPAKPPEAAKPATPPTPEQRTLEAFGRDNTNCREWSDGCAVCIRQDDASVGCSLPGIACVPAAIACRQDAKADAPQKPEAPAK